MDAKYTSCMGKPTDIGLQYLHEQTCISHRNFNYHQRRGLNVLVRYARHTARCTSREHGRIRHTLPDASRI